MEEIKKRKARGICIKDGNLLVIKRLNLERDLDQEYFVLPGGKVEDDESIEDAVIREVFEETSMHVTLGELFKSFTEDTENDFEEHFYLCKYLSGDPALRADSEEAEEMKEGVHFYTPMWLPLSELKNVILYPEEIKMMLIEEFVGGI